MPHKGFKSLTLKQGTYDHFEGLYNDNLEYFEMEGINNLTALFTKLLYMGETDLINEIKAKEEQK